jgi:uncharacterized repeat protein (TIGR01451 family)
MKRTLTRSLRTLALACLGLGLASRAQALIPVPNPGESVLVIYDDVTTYDVSLATAFINALTALSPAPTITSVILHSGSIGIYNSLVAQTGKTDLSSWCQVYDLRFREDKNNIAYTGPNQEDVITFSGANNDTLLYTNYLNQNGHLFLQGEHHDFYIRDLNLFALINSVATVGISSSQVYADYNPMNTGAIGSWPAIASTINALGAGIINAGFPGGLEPGYAGSGQPVGAYFPCTIYCGGGAQANTAYYWDSSSLKTTGGRMVVNFETNAFVSPGSGSVAVQWMQNMYGLLSGCYRYSLTKAFNPSNLCVGDSGAFTLCYTNSGSTTLTNVPLWDTLPVCLTYNSDSLGASVNGQLLNWTIPSVASGASACVTVNFTVANFSCP